MRRTINSLIPLAGSAAICSAEPAFIERAATLVCDECMDGIRSQLPEVARKKQFEYACQALASHFVGIPPDRLVATSRQFPGHMRADVQVAVDKLFSVAVAVFRHPRAAPLRDVDFRGTEP